MGLGGIIVNFYCYIDEWQHNKLTCLYHNRSKVVALWHGINTALYFHCMTSIVIDIQASLPQCSHGSYNYVQTCCCSHVQLCIETYLCQNFAVSVIQYVDITFTIPCFQTIKKKFFLLFFYWLICFALLIYIHTSIKKKKKNEEKRHQEIKIQAK